ncbi:hypothetical protein HPDFL43_03501 [Hoeflea phototrophica DFL-43]|uniref:DUF983 domain-containing protein n=1 Tax=Hoeflea phototrophica (strain DSM 17068 / NCIMB 14078 / DFL-43) TaxID=411684 RepID=A9DAJ1_HOEPD|nr:DUF983 domain-containing protein [Hoeflea phototrophica]EDQ32577.1 hypothetical protein HPDFL43_03501 [Hoeflea phototrophica DFL-43]
MTKDQAHYPPVDAVSVGLSGRCPRCGDGALFAGFLSVKPACGACGLDYSFADAGDGPAVFVIMIVGFIVVGLALWLEVNYSPALWVHLIMWIPLATVLSLGLLRALKGLMIALQYRNKAAEGQIDHG